LRRRLSEYDSRARSDGGTEQEGEQPLFHGAILAPANGAFHFFLGFARSFHPEKPRGAAIARHPHRYLWHDEDAVADTTIRTLGLGVVVAYASLIGWAYARQPHTLAQVTGGLSAVVGAYAVDEQAFADGLRFFNNDQFVEARLAFARADPAVRDARTQFYIAYSYYRQGWGRAFHDDDLYREGLAAIDRAVELAPAGRLVVDDPTLGMHTPEEVKAELEAGIRVDASDFNPSRLFRARK
jgi:hypothetical protein